MPDRFDPVDLAFGDSIVDAIDQEIEDLWFPTNKGVSHLLPFRDTAVLGFVDPIVQLNHDRCKGSGFFICQALF